MNSDHGHPNILRGVGNGVIAGAFWGIVFLAPQLLPGFSSLQLSVGRYLIYGLIALGLLLPKRQVLARISRRECFALIWLSLAGNIVYYVLLGKAVQSAGGAATSLIIGLLPVIVTLVGLKETSMRELPRLIPPLLLCCLGVGFIAWQAFGASGPQADASQSTLGLLCAFGALGSWAAYAVGNSRYLKHLAHVSSHDWSLLTGVVTGALALLLAPIAFAPGSAPHSQADWLYFWAVSAAVAVFASIIGNRFWNQASRLLPLTLTGQMIIFETLFALLYSFVWEQRWPTGLEGLAMLCLLLGISWCTSVHRVPTEA